MKRSIIEELSKDIVEWINRIFENKNQSLNLLQALSEIINFCALTTFIISLSLSCIIIQKTHFNQDSDKIYCNLQSEQELNILCNG